MNFITSNLTEVLFFCLAGIIGLYLAFRVVSTAIFRSWWDTKIWFAKRLHKSKKEGKEDE